jgi:hypothetical protein
LSPPECIWELSRWLHEICLPRSVCHHFQPGLILLPKSVHKWVVSSFLTHPLYELWMSPTNCSCENLHYLSYVSILGSFQVHPDYTIKTLC